MSIQDYELLSKIGSGSFGVVHKAREKKTNAICVVKIVDCSQMNTKLRKNAMQQGRILKQANSPFIVKHFNTFINKSTLYIVMQYCPKGDLTSYMKSQMGKPLKQQTIWKFSIQMMGGLRDLHSKKILHRDIKSLNVFLDQNYNAKIGDLGVAKSMTGEFAHTIVGTPYYLSPEMCQQKPYNQKTDIWAMGCIIYQLCTGRRPFQANNQAALALKIVMGKYDSLPAHYSSDLIWIVKSCLAIDYKRRPTAAYMLDMPKTKQWATKLNISLNKQSNKEDLKISNLIKQKSKQDSAQKKKIAQKSSEAKIKNISVQIPKDSRLKQAKQQQEKLKNKEKLSKQKIKEKQIQKQKQKQKEKEKQKQKQKIIKLNKDAQKNVKQVLNNKIPYDSKPVKYSGAKRLEMMSKEAHQKQKISIKKNEQQKLKSDEKLKVKSQQIKRQMPSRLSNNGHQKQQKKEVKQQKAIDVSKYASQPAGFNKDRKQKLMNATMNRFLPQTVKKKKQIDLQDESKIEEVKLVDSSDSSQEDKVHKKSSPKKQQIFQNVQQSVDQDELMKAFGFPKSKEQNSSNKKKEQVQDSSGFCLDKKPISINWNQIGIQKQSLKKNKSILPQLPTIRTPSTNELEQLPEMKIEQPTQDGIMEDIDQNRPYISDEENGSNEQVEELEQFLIQDMDQKQQDLSQKLMQNKKRKLELQKMKNHFEPELLKLLPKAEYERLKVKVMDCKQGEVDDFVSGWKNNIQSMNLFYRILHFDMEIKRCDKNLCQIEERLKQIQKQKQ